MSPEILNERGHDTNSDWWSLGILLYELATGSPPFSNRNIDRIAQSIQFGEFPLKEYFSPAFAALLTGLTNKNPTKRLGSIERGGINSIKNHKFFKGIDWAKVLNLEYPAPL